MRAFFRFPCRTVISPRRKARSLTRRPEAFEEPHAWPIQQHADQARSAVQLGKDYLNLVRSTRPAVASAFGTARLLRRVQPALLHVLTKKQNRFQNLVLR